MGTLRVRQLRSLVQGNLYTSGWLAVLYIWSGLTAKLKCLPLNHTATESQPKVRVSEPAHDWGLQIPLPQPHQP